MKATKSSQAQGSSRKTPKDVDFRNRLAKLKKRPQAMVDILALPGLQKRRKTEMETVLREATPKIRPELRIRAGVVEDRGGSNHGDNYVCKKIFVERAYEKAREKYGNKVGFKESDVVLDFGSNIGCFSVAALLAGCGTVVAVEASKESYEICKANLKHFARKTQKQKTLHAALVADGSSSHLGCAVYMYTKIDKRKNEDDYEHAPSRPNRNSLIKDEVNNSNLIVEKVDVVRTLASLCKETKATTVKMDIEGAEVDVLAATTKLPNTVQDLMVYYHFDKFPHMKVFKGFVKSLERLFKNVHIVPTPGVPKNWDWKEELKTNPDLKCKNPGGFASAKKDILVYCSDLK